MFKWCKLAFYPKSDAKKVALQSCSEKMIPGCIDRFQVSHFRPVVIEIEIGGRSEKSLGGQESAAVDQECMGSNASSCSFALSFPIYSTAFFFFFAGTCLMSGAANSP